MQKRLVPLVLCLLSLLGCETVVVRSPSRRAARPALKLTPNCSNPRRCPAPGDDRGPCDSRRCPLQRDVETRTRWAVPYCDLPEQYRVRNYAGGSCVHASLETLMHWQGQHELAKWWRANYAGGEYPTRCHERLEQAGIRFAFTESRSAEGWEFLRKCCALRLGCAVNLPTGHMQTLVGMDERSLYVIDNNGRGEIDVWSRERFAQAWTGWAVTVVGQAPPPEPFL